MHMKEKEKPYLNDPTAEICYECRRRTVELTLQAIGIPIDAADRVLEKVEVLEHRAKILEAERSMLTGEPTYTVNRSGII